MSLLLGAAFAFTASAIYAYVGHRLARRPSSLHGQLAVTLFALWWYALAASTAINGIEDLLAHAGVRRLDVFVTASLVNILAVCIAMWGLLYYLLFLFTGNRSMLLPLSLFYVLYYTLLVYYVTHAAPVGLDVGEWDVALEYAHPNQGPLFTVVLVLLVAPAMLASLGYLTFLREVKDRSQRYRILVVSLSIIIWFGSALAGAASNLASLDGWQIFTRLLGAVAATSILLAYHPPRFLQRRLGVEPIAQRD
jgi:hypothetical protein